MTQILLLCFEFFKIGLFAVGGGMATIPFLMQLSEKYPMWYSMETLTDMIAVSESTPGPVGINMATFVGFTVGGVPGGILASISLVVPSIIIVNILARFLDRYQNNPFVESVFSGLRPAVVGLISAAGLQVLLVTFFQGGTFSGLASVQWGAVLAFLVFFAATRIKAINKLHPIVFISIGAVIGMVFKF